MDRHLFDAELFNVSRVNRKMEPLENFEFDNFASFDDVMQLWQRKHKDGFWVSLAVYSSKFKEPITALIRYPKEIHT